MTRAPVIETEALVLRRFDYSETSQIARLYTRESGRLSVIAKGVKRPNRDLQGPLDLLCLAKVSYLERPESDLLVLRSYHVTTGFPGMRDELERLIGAFYLAELLCEGTRDHDPDQKLFDLWVDAFRSLETASPAECDAIVLRAELGFLEVGGFLSSLEACVRCGSDLASAVGSLDPARGGVVCAACSAAHAGDGTRLTAGQLRTIAHLRKLPPARARTVAILPRDRRVLRRAINALIEHVLEKELQSAPFLGRPLATRRASGQV